MRVPVVYEDPSTYVGPRNKNGIFFPQHQFNQDELEHISTTVSQLPPGTNHILRHRKNNDFLIASCGRDEHGCVASNSVHFANDVPESEKKHYLGKIQNDYYHRTSYFQSFYTSVLRHKIVVLYKKTNERLVLMMSGAGWVSGSGGSAKVKYALEFTSQALFAIKIIHIEDQYHEIDIKKEITVLEKIGDLVVAYHDNGKYYIVTRAYQNTLRDSLGQFRLSFVSKERETKSEYQLRLTAEFISRAYLQSIVTQVTQALESLYHLNQIHRVIHGDFKTSNIMVTHDHSGPRVNIIDYGCSRILPDGKKEWVGMGYEISDRPAHIPVECFFPNKESVFSAKSDSFAAGYFLLFFIERILTRDIANAYDQFDRDNVVHAPASRASIQQLRLEIKLITFLMRADDKDSRANLFLAISFLRSLLITNHISQSCSQPIVPVYHHLPGGFFQEFLNGRREFSELACELKKNHPYFY